MDSEYDRKFEEMKHYIPFLENMISRLESSNTTSSNPRQAQLDKIRSLRDLLSNKKKRMKMENLLKCEQVLVNLYAKVEQRDTLSGVKKPTDSFSIDSPTPKEKSDLEAVRNKLKTVAKRQEVSQDTLPEILPRSEVKDVHTSGTKEPALFQRRPNQPPNQTNKESDERDTSPQGSASKRNYTRVLVSPESRRWTSTQTAGDKLLFSRRSPRKSPRRYSPSYHKKERKKTQSQNRKDLNITLNVPEESLNSLNTKDILSRIINCSDGDVDIATLRELRKQILGELQKTGARDDISDLILKSYNKEKHLMKEEIEEGELSDSESEAIESIYGSLVVKEPGPSKVSSEKDTQPRKIQICLVINSDDKPASKIKMPKQDFSPDFAELEMYEKVNNEENNTNPDNECKKGTNESEKADKSEGSNKPDETYKLEGSNKPEGSNNSVDNNLEESTASDHKSPVKDEVKNDHSSSECKVSTIENITDLNNSMAIVPKDNNPKTETVSATPNKNVTITPNESVQFKANFYKPIMEQSNSENVDLMEDKSTSQIGSHSQVESAMANNLSEIENTLEQMEKSPEIPLLHERTVEKKPPDSTLSEIDILQALKNEILSDITMPVTETITPHLHQPKVIKVASAQGILPKKRISIEKYKEKSVASSKPHVDQISLKDDQMKKSSLKLTERECERFFNFPKISFDDDDGSLGEDEDDDILASDVYSDLAPKSPDHEDPNNVELATPAIIPADLVKAVQVNHKADIDMRTLPVLSPNNTKTPTLYNNTASTSKNDTSGDKKGAENIIDILMNNSKNRPPLIDPRVKRDLTPNANNQSPNPHAGQPERISRHSMFAGISASSTPNPIMTPNARTYEMTPTHQSYELDQSSRNHVYVPTMTSFDCREKEKPVTNEARPWENVDTAGERRSRIDDNKEGCWNPSHRENLSQNSRFNETFNVGQKNDVYRRSDGPAPPVTSTQPFARLEPPMPSLLSFGRVECPTTQSHAFGRLECPSTPNNPFGLLECPPTPNQNFGRLECPSTPSHHFGRTDCPPATNHPFGRSDCPTTPNHPFGRSDCPPTLNHPFGRSDCPPTPNHPFGRADCPPTPNHPFGRADCPPTPNHPFGRADCPPTPSHPFGRADCPPTPNHPFGRSDCPPTPNHPFGRSDCPPTPNLPFGRLDCPPTPIHSFGRTDVPPPLMLAMMDCPPTPINPFCSADGSATPTPLFGRNECPQKTFAQSDCTPTQTHSFSFLETQQSHSYNLPDPKNNLHRSDFNTQKFTKDPRLNRKPESDIKSHHDERDRGYNKERNRYRGSSYSSQKYSGSDNYRSYDRNSRYRYHTPDRKFEKDQEKYGRSVRHSVSKDQESDRSHSRDRRYGSEVRSHEEVGSRREKSVGRSLRPEERNRDTSVGKKYSRELEQSKPNVESFNIDTSINSTFQKHFDSAKDKLGFDARRQRAASVGRSLARESSVGRSLCHVSKPNMIANQDKREAFRRASSVGRDIFESNIDRRSFQEIKADFKSYRFSSKEFANRSSESHNSYKSKETVTQSGRSRKDIHERQRSEKRGPESSKSSYSPRKNYRDPRMRKQMDNKSDRYGNDAYGRRSGIVYSNDNIVKGSILTSGYGVKNYKIPKIKRVPEEKEIAVELVEIDEVTEKEKDKKKLNDNKELEKEKPNIKDQQKVKDKLKNITKDKSAELGVTSTEEKKKVCEDASKSDDIVERRLTRSSRKSLIQSKTDIAVVTKTKKYKKVIYDSNSDSDIDTNDEHTDTRDVKVEECNTSAKSIAHGSPVKKKNTRKKLDSDDLDSSFGMDELEIFSDNIASDPAIDNIHDLIADLDDDLSPSKGDSSHNFTNEITLENMMQNISSPAKDNSIEVGDDSNKIIDATDNISNDEVIVKDSKNMATGKGPKELKLGEITNDNEKYSKSPIRNTPSQSDTKRSKENDDSDNLSSCVAKSNCEHIDSTTKIEKYVKPAEVESTEDQITDACSTPDSTINTDEASQKSTKEESLPGSANEVTSTESIEPKPSPTAKETVPGLDSLGSLLSILQDKSKIKELLNMLGDQSSENDKIKKKLEKLSEIVSDDEETSDLPATKTESAEQTKVGPSNEVDKKVESSIDEEVKSFEDEQLSKDSSIVLTADEPKVEDDDTKTSDIEVDTRETDTEVQNNGSKPKKKPGKKTKGTKKSKLKLKKTTPAPVKRVTRATAKPKVKKPPRELTQLQEDIKEMFIRDQVLSATGIRMCRLAKLVDEKVQTSKEESVLPEGGPVVVLEKFKDTNDKNSNEKVKKKKIGPKNKVKTLNDRAPDTARHKAPLKNKPGPKSKTKNKKDDPYAFESDSVGDTYIEKASDDGGSSSSSDSESDSLASFKSFGSCELLADIKKKTKRKRRGWQAGVIKTKTKKKKVEPKQAESRLATFDDVLPEKGSIPDLSCFTDRNYCFRKNQLTYPCRLCSFSGTDIVLHYRNDHPHVEIPLSRMTPDVAKEAIEQCEEINFKAISKIPSDKYVCTFCFKEFVNSKSVLETFFWHIVSVHTGEYKQICSKCDNANECIFNLDIPPPPKDIKGQLIGFICKKCNFTQISLENLKTHVIVRHNDEQTAVYTINLSVMTKKSLNLLLRRSETEQAVSQTSTRSSIQSVAEISEKHRDSIESNCENDRVKTRTSTRRANQSASPPIQSKITFEGDDNISEMSDLISETSEAAVKIERIDTEPAVSISNKEESSTTDVSEIDKPSDVEDRLPEPKAECPEPQPSNDIVDCAHFKINHTESGAKEYYCCINGNYHFKTTLLISMKKHVQFKHSENWDGYCNMCKVIVTPQGVHRFKDCLQHYLDKHIDSFPIFEKEIVEAPPLLPLVNTVSPVANSPSPKPYINVRPISELITKTENESRQEAVSLPIIQSVVSLGAPAVEPSPPSSTSSAIREEQAGESILKYEEHQAEVISKKHNLVIQEMLAPNVLIKIFKCAGRYCVYATDSAEDALAHATTHQRIGGIDALNCSYCSFDSAGNAVDLVMHVFECHGRCQYCCPNCFYRAASNQSVGAHLSRVHGGASLANGVMRPMPAPSIPPTKHNVLTREEAVPYYVCGHSDGEGFCKFRTYTPEKLCEHLIQRHPRAMDHPCHLCSKSIPTATALVHHMKSHGLMLYQCTWCVHGADNEADMMHHISSVHPDKPPQAYIRMITSKDRSTERRVLPLAFLIKFKVQLLDVVPRATKDHPVHEAERSVEMEALFKPFKAGLNIASTEVSIQTEETPEVIEIPQAIETPKKIEITQKIKTPPAIETPRKIELPPETETSQEIETPQIIDIPEVIETPQEIETPQAIETPRETKPLENIITLEPTTIQASEVVPSSISTPIVTPKTECQQIPQVKIEQDCKIVKKDIVPDVVVLDSDDEDTPMSQPIIDLSEDDLTQSSKEDDTPIPKVIPNYRLHVCPKCKQVYKSMGGLKKHIYSCSVDEPIDKCPHCMHKAGTLEKLMWHYVAFHSEKNTYECGLCGALLLSDNFAKKHMKNIHKESNTAVTPTEKNGTARFIINPKTVDTSKEQIVPKRKLSGPNPDVTPAKRRFEPHEINQLPINPILDHPVYCSLCEFSTKVRLNMVRHLQLHAEQQPVPQTAPVNPVPYLESNEKHFDKMVNLASSSTVNRTPDKPRPEPPAAPQVPPEAAARYPRFVPERQRHTCGAKGCAYTSLDEAMLRRHWDTLHAGASDFHCVHCPPHQHLDTSKPLTATRIVSHLKMHDATLYACSVCSYYHFKREALEKHLADIHTSGRLMVVREEGTAPVLPTMPPQNVAAPTMDLKPWQCGQCRFKSMLRPEVVEHCSKFHQSKMQYKCAYCPFRTSAIENVSKHQANSHAGKAEEVFYYYYREGSIPDEADGLPRWMKQRQKGYSEADVKVEASSSPVPKTVPSTTTNPLSIDLKLVKKEVGDMPLNMEDLCEKFGQYCSPNGMEFVCPLCSIVKDNKRERMQSHLYEELNYRKWSCGLCSYKAFHKAGLTEHMTSEHRRQYEHIELPADVNIENWVTGVLNHQAAIIEKQKVNLENQKIVFDDNKPGPSTGIVIPKEPAKKYSDSELEAAFGTFGAPKNFVFCCPKCGFMSKEEVVMSDHLEMELNKIRWCCNNCPEHFQTYHEAQFHCKGHDGPTRPIEAIRDPAMRSAWLSTTLQTQKNIIQNMPSPATPSTSEPHTTEFNTCDSDNSLLVVRYEERVPTPEVLNVRRKRTASDSDDVKLVVDEPTSKKKSCKSCSYCEYKSSHSNNLKLHMLTHFNLKPYTCGYCKFNSYNKKTIAKHIEQMHANKPVKIKLTELPAGDKMIDETVDHKLVCLVCETSVPESQISTHLHNNAVPEFANTDIVFKCCICITLCKNTQSYQEHHNAMHPGVPINYALYRLGYDSREAYECAYCNKKFKYIKDYKSHHLAVHESQPFNISSWTYTPPGLDAITAGDVGTVVSKRCARKSTTKLPNSIAKKSTTKLPYSVPSSLGEEYSYYGTKPSPIQDYSNVTTLMSFCNMMVPFTMKQLSEHLNIEPRVVVTDIKNASD